ncbi:MAG TPA: ABC transporter permease [Chthonomonadaceae bacterium]|nr:ABC transporter permease [Chthonomonadaceae bacterium]
MDAPPAAPSAPSRPKGGLALLAALQRYRESSVVLVLIVLCVALYFSPAHATFYSRANLQNLLLQIALLSVFAIGETIVIITGGIDLSLGSLIAFSGMVLALAVTQMNARMYTGVAIGGAIVIALLVSVAVGAFHATLVHRLRLPPFVVTLASLTILRSQSLLMNRQLPISLSDFPFLTNLANGRLFERSVFPIPVPVVIVGLIAIVVHLLLKYARIGRYLYSVGSNEQATRLSGVNVGRVKLFAYGASALLGGVAGILYAGYGGQGDPLSGGGYELNAVAAAVIGGTDLRGGQGSIAGTLLGACLLNVILSGINLTIANPSLWEGTVVGGVLLLAVLTTALQQRNKTNA